MNDRLTDWVTWYTRVLFAAMAAVLLVGVAGDVADGRWAAVVLAAGYLVWLVAEAPVTFGKPAEPATEVRTILAYGSARTLVVCTTVLPGTRWSVWFPVALALFAGGVAVRTLAIRHLAAQYTHHVVRRSGHVVVTSGPYRFVRHPAYAGMLLANLAFVLYFLNPASVAAFVVLTGALVWRIRTEERAMWPVPGYPEFARGRGRGGAGRGGLAGWCGGVVWAGVTGVGDPRLTDPAEVGHKFARQEVLRRAGFPVPDFFCVPAAEFDAVAGGLLAAAPGADSPPDVLLDWARAASAALTATPLPAGLAERIRAAMGGDMRTDLLAVRACVVADEHGVGEDGVTDAFAGLTDSFLYVRPEDVPRRVAQCWASGLSPESVLYRARTGLAPSSVRVAVGVQRMVPGVRSFVAFSRDPRGGRERVIAAAHGIGEGVVAERADVDHFFVDPDDGTIRAETVRKERMVTASGTTPVPAELAVPPVLDDEQVRQVAELAADVEKTFGLPQDIEGTITADGRVHLVQARPVVFAKAPVPRIPWSNNNITESFAGVSGALTFSLALVFYRTIFRDAYRRLGVPARRLDRAEHHLHRMIGLLDGRVYYRLDAWRALHGQIPGFPLVQVWWARSMGLSEREPPTRRQVLRALTRLPGLAVRAARHPSSVRRFLRWWDTLFAATPDMTGWPPERLIAFHRRLWTEVGHWWGVTLVNGFFLLAAATATTAAVRRWVGEDDERIIGGLLLGGRENRSVKAVRSAIHLAELVRQDPALAERVRTGPADEVWAELTEGRFGEAARTHLCRYGDRAPHDLKLEEPSPRQRPAMIVDTIRPMVDSGLTVAGSRATERAGRLEAERELRARCRNPVRRAVVRGLAAVLRWFVKNREDTRYCRSQLFGLSRQVLWRLGDHLVAAGVLDERAEVVDLTVEEVLGAYDGTVVDTDLRAVVAKRRRARAEATARPDLDPELTTTPDLPVTGELPVRTEPSAAEHGELRGLPSSSGVVRYPARVVLDPSISPESCRDHIIVAKETDPGWLFLMMAARGLVVERGTLLSHTAITGRLLGVPTVVSVPGATSLIEDGALIELDGGAGTVRVLP